MRRTGISNRQTPEEEERSRQEHPPLNTGAPPPEDASGRTGDGEPDTEGRQTSHKAGSRSVGQKEAASKYPDRSMPQSRKVAGAYGREPNPEPDADEFAD